MNASHQFSKPHVHLLQVYCFLQIFPGNSEGLATLPAPLCFPRAPSQGVTIPGLLYGRAPPGSTVCSAALWHLELSHPSQWRLVSTSCSLTATRTSLCPGCMNRPVGRCCNVLGSEEQGVKISTSCSKSPKPARTRPWGFACCLSWVVRSGPFPGSSGPSASCSLRCDCISPLRPSRVWKLLLQQQRLSEGSNAGTAAAATVVTEPSSGCP